MSAAIVTRLVILASAAISVGGCSHDRRPIPDATHAALVTSAPTPLPSALASASASSASGDFVAAPEAHDAGASLPTEDLHLRGAHGVAFDFFRVILGDRHKGEQVSLLLRTHLEREKKAFLAEVRNETECATQTPERCAYTLTCAPTLATPRVVSFICSGLEDLGGAHPSKIAFTGNYDLGNGSAVRALTLADVFEPSFLPTVRARVYAALRTQVRAEMPSLAADDDDDDDDDDDSDDPFWQVRHEQLSKEVENFALERGGLRVVFDQFPFVMGPVEVIVPWPELAAGVRKLGPAGELIH